MSYVSENLMANERVYFTARIHPAIFIPSVVAFIGGLVLVAWGLSGAGSQGTSPGMFEGFGLCVSGIFWLASVVYGLQALIIMLTTEFAVTNRRVIAKTGLVRRHTLEMLLSKIESVAVRQDIPGRLLDFGTVTVVGTGGTRESFWPIVAPLALRMKINQIIESSTAGVA